MSKITHLELRLINADKEFVMELDAEDLYTQDAVTLLSNFVAKVRDVNASKFDNKEHFGKEDVDF